MVAAARQRKHIFLIYGSEGEASRTVLRFLHGIGLNPSLLHDREPQQVVERFESYASDCYAIVLLTPDEGSRWHRQLGDSRMSPAQNVVFKLGYFIGKFGRRYVTALYSQDLELPTAFSEIVCMPMDEIGIWKFALLRDLVAAGFPVQQNLALYRPRTAAPAPAQPPRPLAGRSNNVP